VEPNVLYCVSLAGTASPPWPPAQPAPSGLLHLGAKPRRRRLRRHQVREPHLVLSDVLADRNLHDHPGFRVAHNEELNPVAEEQDPPGNHVRLTELFVRSPRPPQERVRTDMGRASLSHAATRSHEQREVAGARVYFRYYLVSGGLAFHSQLRPTPREEGVETTCNDRSSVGSQHHLPSVQLLHSSNLDAQDAPARVLRPTTHAPDSNPADQLHRAPLRVLNVLLVDPAGLWPRDSSVSSAGASPSYLGHLHNLKESAGLLARSKQA